jgi:heterodisulfide reductase subunit A
MSGPNNGHGAPAAAGKPLTFSLNGVQVEAQAGQTILEAARAKGVVIPTLCHHPALEAYGGCRLCMVEITQGKRKRLVTSCNYEVREGLEVQSDSERVHKSRRMSLELLLARCPEVQSIRELAGKYGVQTPRFPLEKEDCILCGLCVRICRERMGPGVADFVGRGADIKVDTPYHRGSEVCLECGACESVCPTHSIRLKTVYEVPPVEQLSEFDQRLRQRPTIYIPFPQALPNAPVLDRTNCVRFRQAERGVEACGICAEACPVKAIDYNQTDQTVSIEAGAVILAPGFCAYDPAGRPGLHAYAFPNVVSSLQFERILSASGPYMGRVQRPSDFRKPERIAFIQCVGSRDEQHNYCSSVCCMYAIKEAIIAKEHEADLACEVFYMDVRAHGKGFDAYYERAKELGIRFTRCRPSKIEEIEDRRLRIGFVGEDDQRYQTRDFDLVILSVGLEPPAEARELAATFGIELNQHGFAATRPFDAVATTRDGVWVAGPFAAPKDIPETVVESSSAAARAMVALAEARGTLVTKKELVPERNVTGEPPRIGVFVCHCGRNIGSVVNVPSVAEYARRLPRVVYATDNLYTCSSDTQELIKARIQEHRLNRVIVASCSPRTHEPLFQQTIREAGLNPNLFEMANIRDQCSWVHMHEQAEATIKAKDLVRMAVAKANLIEPLGSLTLPVTQKALVVGGGVAGLTAALALADQGFPVTLVEKAPELGGNALRAGLNLEGRDIGAHVRGLIRRVKAHDKITTYTNARLESVEGFVGNFKSKVSVSVKASRAAAQHPAKGAANPAPDKLVEVEHGVVILAAGGRESVPREYLYGKNPRVKTLLECSQLAAAEDCKVPDSVVFIQCVGSREPDHPYCSRLCCAGALKNAIRMKEKNPAARIFILYRDLRAYGFREQHYTRARELGVIFVQYDPEAAPSVREAASGNGQALLIVGIHDKVLDADLEIEADLLVLSARVDPNPENVRLAQLFKVPLNSDGFFLEAHAKLRPVEFATDGVYMAGAAHYPKDAEESSSQALAASSRAATVLSKDTVEAGGKTAYINPARCSACGACLTVCPYNAICIDEDKEVAVINEILCKGCGACVATCKGSAPNLRGFKDEQILSVINAL